MKKVFILMIIVLSAAIFSNVAAQGDSDLRDTNIKGRSNELERIDRDAKKESKKNKNKKPKDDAPPATPPPAAAPPVAAPPPEDHLTTIFPQIKEDYESIQKSQVGIIDAYANGKTADYAQIAKLAAEINRNAVRLDSNLFSPPAAPEAKKEEKPTVEKNTETKNLRGLIVELDDAVAAFISSSMFQNLRTADPTVSEKARQDLQQIIKSSEAVGAEVTKLQNDRK
ncbi:MAG: hypothetical protein M3T96_09090 [Acidobacteriota bacterium]|nr:hypothetical protein [Acidobacteriota bacterium]